MEINKHRFLRVKIDRYKTDHKSIKKIKEKIQRFTILEISNLSWTFS